MHKKKYISGSNMQLNTLIYPLFVISGYRKKNKILSMPGVFQFSIDMLIKEIEKLYDLGLRKYLLFGIPDSKNWEGTNAYNKDNIVIKAIEKLKKRFINITIMTDVCLCSYTEHGHCGIIDKGKNFINRQKTLKALSDIALSHARVGADYVSPSAMTQGQVKAIRKKLNENQFKNVKIMGYSAKFASNFYGPFRNAANSAPAFGDRTDYQLDYRKLLPALKKVNEDLNGGADIIMVKPALGYLDVIRKVKDSHRKTLAAYNVSGEYAFVKFGAQKKICNERNIVNEILSSIKRAGADLIITYHAKDIAKWQI